MKNEKARTGLKFEWEKGSLNSNAIDAFEKTTFRGDIRISEHWNVTIYIVACFLKSNSKISKMIFLKF